MATLAPQHAAIVNQWDFAPGLSTARARGPEGSAAQNAQRCAWEQWLAMGIPNLTTSDHDLANVISYIDKLGLEPFLNKVVAIASRSFSVVGPIAVSRESDPDVNEEWLELTVFARGTSQEVIASHDQFVRQWMNAVPDDVRACFRLSYRVA